MRRLHPNTRQRASSGLLHYLLAGSLSCSALILASHAAQAQDRHVLVVGVSEVAKGTPLADAEIYLPELRRRTRTDQSGEARLSGIPTGVYEVRVRRLGFAAAAVLVPLDRDSVNISVLLRPSAAELDTVHVVETAYVQEMHRQFELRRKKGLGRFLAPDVLASASTLEFPVVAIQHFPGLVMITGRGGQWQLASRHGSCGVDTTYEGLSSSAVALSSSPGGSKVGGAGSGARQTASEAATSPSSCFSDHPCHVKLFLDDQPVAEADINIVHTSELYGVEYYASGNAPPQYQLSGSACGVMLLWTKRGGG